jgi:Tfp pilus assembly protein PilP
MSPINIDKNRFTLSSVLPNRVVGSAFRIFARPSNSLCHRNTALKQALCIGLLMAFGVIASAQEPAADIQKNQVENPTKNQVNGSDQNQSQNQTQPGSTIDPTAAFEETEVRTPFGISMDPFEYEERGRRDPFVQPLADKPMLPGQVHGPLLPLQRFDINQMALVGIIWDVRKPKAMLKDPSGMTHIVGPNTKIGPRNGYIAVIREGEIVVIETIDQEGKLVSTAQVVKIAK